MALTACYDGSTQATTYWDVKGMWPACGLGATAQQAKDGAAAAFLTIGIVVSETAAPNTCTYEYLPITGCSCDAGIQSTRSYSTSITAVRPPPRVLPPVVTPRVPSGADRARQQ